MFTAKRPLLFVAVMAASLSAGVTGARSQTVVADLAPAAPTTQNAVIQTAVPVAPTDPVKRAAFNVLDTHCARCHQSDRLVGRSKPAKGFGNILNLDEVAANAKYIKPGDADRSLLYHVIVRHEMPSDVFQDGDLDHPTPDDKDLQTLRTWIVSLASPDAVAHKSVPAADVYAYASPNMAPALQSKPIDLKAGKGGAMQVASLAHAGEPVPAPLGEADRGPLTSAPVASLGNRELVADAQDQLQKLGCFTGQVNGVLDSATDKAIARYNGKLGRGEQITAVTPELLEELRSQSGRICAPLCPRGQISDGFQCVPDPGLAAERPARVKPVEPGVASQTDKHRQHTQDPAVASKTDRQQRRDRGHEPAVASRQAPTERQAPPRRTAHELHLRQPVFRQAQQRAPVYRSAPSTASSASDTISGVNGI